MNNRYGGHDRGGHGGYGGHDRGGHGGGYGGGHGGGHGNRRRGVPLSDLDPELTDASRRVIGCAIEVHKTLGPGYSRDIYLKALQYELKEEGLGYKLDHPFDVEYDDQVFGTCEASLYVDDRFLVDVLAFNGEVGSAERSQLRATLRAADLELGLIINFGERRLKDGLVRVLNPDKIEALREEREEDEYEDDDEDDSHDHDEGGDDDA